MTDNWRSVLAAVAGVCLWSAGFTVKQTILVTLFTMLIIVSRPKGW